MILVLNGADFSENNLGQVEVNYDLNQFTKAAIAASGNASLTEPQNRVLDKFFKKLGAFGSESNIWSKMQYVFLPMLSSDLAHSMVNYVGNDASIVPDADKFQLRNHGITGYDSTEQTINVTAGTAINLQDMSVLFMNTENLAHEKKLFVGSSNTARGTWGFSTASNGNIILGGSYNTGNPTINKVFCDVSNIATNYNKLGGYSVYGTTYLALDSNGTVGSYTESAIPSGSSTNVKLFRSLSHGITSDASATGLLMIGTHLTDAELLVVKSVAEDLRSAMMA